MSSVPVPGFSFPSPLVASPVSCILCPSGLSVSSWTAENGWQGPAPRRSRRAARHISKHQPHHLTSGGIQLVLQLLSKQNSPRIISDSSSEHLWPMLTSEQRLPRLTVSVVDMDITLWNMVLQPECLLSMESLREDSLWDTDMRSLLVAWDRKCRQGTFSASVSLLKITIFLQITHLISWPEVRWWAALTYIWNEWLHRWRGCRWLTPWRW